MSTETLELIIRTSGASQGAEQLRNLGSQARNTQSAIVSLNGTLALMRQTLVALSFIRAFEGITRSISEVQSINNMLMTVTKTAADVPKAFNQFSDIAAATHAPLEAVTNFGVALARSSASANLSSQQIGDAVTTVFNTFRLSGNSPTQIRNVANDLKELFSLGAVQGRQLRAILLQDQPLAILLANQLHATGTNAVAMNKALDEARAKGQRPALYELNQRFRGAITTSDITQALISGTAETTKQVAKLPITLGQAFTDLQNKWLAFVNALSNSGVFQPLIDLVEYLANNLPTIAAAVLAVGASWASWLIVRQVAAGIVGLSNAFMAATRATAAFFSLTTGMASVLVVGFLAVGAILALVFGEKLSEAARNVGGWGELLIRVMALTSATIQTVFTNLWATIGNLFILMLNGIIGGINFISTKLNIVLPKSLQIGQIAAAANPYSDQLRKSFQENVTANYAALEKSFGGKGTATGLPDYIKPPTAPDDAGVTADLYKKQRDALQQLENQLSRFATPSAKFRDDIDKVDNKILDIMKDTVNSKGEITAYGATFQQVSDVFKKLGFNDFNKDTMQSAEFIKATAREMLGLKNATKETADFIQFVNEQLAAHNIDQAEANKLIEDATRKRDLYNLSLLKTAEAGRQIALINFAERKGDLNKIGEEVTNKALTHDLAGDINTYITQVNTLNASLADHSITNEAYVKTLQDIQKAYLETGTDGISGFQKGLLEVQQTMFNTAGDAAKVLTDAFGGLQNSLVEFATTGKFNIHDMATSILKDFDTLIVKQAIMQPLVSALGFGPGSNLGIGQSNGGLGGFLGGLLGGSSSGAGGQLGASAATPVWVSVAPSTGDVFSGLTGGSGAGGASGGGLTDMFSQGGFLSNLFSGTGGGAGSASSGILDTLMNVGSLFGFATGGEFLVGGQGGTDSQLVAFRASPDERVSVQTPAQQRTAQNAQKAPGLEGGVHVHLHGVQDFDSFKRSKGQLSAGIGQAINHSLKRNGH